MIYFELHLAHSEIKHDHRLSRGKWLIGWVAHLRRTDLFFDASTIDLVCIDMVGVEVSAFGSRPMNSSWSYLSSVNRDYRLV